MRTLNLIMVLALGLFIAGCGQQNNSNNNSQYNQFVNSHDGVEVKAPSKVNPQMVNNNMGMVQQGDILLSLDSNGTYHLRSGIPEEMYGDNRELTGIRGQYDVDSRGVLRLKQGGQVIAESAFTMGVVNTSNLNTFNLNFVQPVSIDMIQLNNQVGYNGGNFTSFQTIQVPIQGYTTVTR